MVLAREAGTVLNEAMTAALTKRGRVSDSSMSQFAIYYHSNVVSRLRAVLGVSSLDSRHVGHMAMIVKSAVYAAVVRMERDAQEQSHIPLPVVFNPQDHFCYCQRVCGWAMFSLMQCLWADMARALAAEEARGAQNPTRRHVRQGDLRARRCVLALQRLSQDQKKTELHPFNAAWDEGHATFPKPALLQVFMRQDEAIVKVLSHATVRLASLAVTCMTT